MGGTLGVTKYTPEFAERLYSYITSAAAQPDVRAAVDANHDDNRWWPAYVSDWRVRMVVAGWSTRVSYAMVGTYADVVAQADALGWDSLTALNDQSLSGLVRPIGLLAARIRYLRSLAGYIEAAGLSITDVTASSADELIGSFKAGVAGAGYNIAQCAVLYARGYHCGVIPVDSGMVTKLAPLLGITLATGPAAHEHLRTLLQSAAVAKADAYRKLVSRLGYDVTIPGDAPPTWFVHLVLIYFKRLYLNRIAPELCVRRPACAELFGCHCLPEGAVL